MALPRMAQQLMMETQQMTMVTSEHQL